MLRTNRDLIQSLADQYRPVFENSPDGVYLWLDETHKVCNARLARMFGCTIDEWSATEPFLETFVAAEDRALYSRNYHRCVAELAHPVTFRFTGQRKDGSTFPAETDMIPISWHGHAVAYHFVRQIATSGPTGERER
jgi:PAS domain S-box-containing protein